jgi:hypothetical protein
MKHHYQTGAVRWFRWALDKDVRLHRAPKGWKAQADLIDRHPITGKDLKQSQWWVREEYVGAARDD